MFGKVYQQLEMVDYEAREWKWKKTHLRNI